MVDSAGQVMLTGVEVGFVSQEVKTELAAATAIKMSETKTASQIIRENPLANAEVDEEGNYNMIDGVPNNGWGEKKKPKEEIVADDTEMKKESVLGKLEHYKELVGSGDNNEERSL